MVLIGMWFYSDVWYNDIAIGCSRNYSAERRFERMRTKVGQPACALPGSHIHMANGCLQTMRVIVAYKNFLHAIHLPLYLGIIYINCFYSSKTTGGRV